MLKIARFFLVLLCCGFISCARNDDSGVKNEYAHTYIQNLNSSNNFFSELPINQRGNADLLTLDRLQEFEKLTGLKSISKGFDSIEIRMFFGHTMVEQEKLVVLRNDGERWVAELSEIYYHFYENGGIDSIRRRVVYDNPKSGWVKFINKLFDLKILTIEDDNKLPAFQSPSVMDGCSINVEIATKNAYRFYTYANPEFYDDKYWQAANILSIQKLLNDEFKTLKVWKTEAEQRIKMRIEELENSSNNSKGKIKYEEIIIKNDVDSVKKINNYNKSPL
jgi:hypothetical protein